MSLQQWHRWLQVFQALRAAERPALGRAVVRASDRSSSDSRGSRESRPVQRLQLPPLQLAPQLRRPRPLLPLAGLQFCAASLTVQRQRLDSCRQRKRLHSLLRRLQHSLLQRRE